MADDALNVPTEDFFWDGLLPDNLMTVEGFKANFGVSYNGTQTYLNRRPCKFTVEIVYSDGSVVEKDLAVFLIESIETSGNTASATLTLTSLIQPLMEQDADVVKNGQSWWENVPVEFLITELLRSVYGDEEGLLPEGFIINCRNMRTFNNNPTLSAFGRPPDWDGRNHLDLGLICRALEWGDLGDGNLLYLGCDNEVWVFDPTVGVYTKVCQVEKTIRKLKISGTSLYIMSYDDVPETEANSTFHLTVTLYIHKYTLAAGVVLQKRIDKFWSGEWSFRQGASNEKAVKMYIGNYGTQTGYQRYSAIGASRTTGSMDGSESWIVAGENIPVPFLNKAVVCVRPWDTSLLAAEKLYLNYRYPNKYKSNLTGYEWGDYDYWRWHNAEMRFKVGAVRNFSAAGEWDTDANHAMEYSGPGYVGCSVWSEFTLDPYSGGGVDPLPHLFIRFPLGNDPCFTFFNKFGASHNHLALLFFKQSGADANGGIALTGNTISLNGWVSQIDLCAYDIDNDTEYTVQSDIKDNSLTLYPTCLFVDEAGYGASDYEIYYGGVAWEEAVVVYTDTPATSYSCFRAYKMAAGGTTLGTSSISSARDPIMPFSGVVNRNHSGKEVQLCTFDRSKTTSPDTFQFSYVPKATPDFSTRTDVLASSFPFKHLIVGSDNATYMLKTGDRDGNGGQCQLYKYDASSLEAQDDFRSTVESEGNESSNMVIGADPYDSTMVIYGISAPYYSYPFTDVKLTGRFYLWKFDKHIANRVELADYDGLKVWDALVLHANATRSFVGFDLDNFIFVPRDFDDDPGLVIDCDNDPFIKLEKTQDKEIRNLVRVTPFSSVMQDTEFEVILKAKQGEPDPATTWEGELGVATKTTKSQRLRLRCIVTGNISTTTYSDARFGYLVHAAIIETRLARDLGASDTKVYLPTIYGDINIGDYIVITNPDTKIDVTVRIIGIDGTFKYVTIDAAFGFGVKSLTPVTILPTGATSTNGSVNRNRFSDEGVTYVLNVPSNLYSPALITLASARDIGVGTILRFGVKTTEYIVTTKPEVKIYTDRWDVKVQRVDGLSRETGDIEVSDIVKAYFRPSVQEAYAEVGNTGIELAFLPKTPVYYATSQFKSDYGGDTITITCPGLKLEGDSQSKYSSVDVESIARYGRREYSIPDNRFVHHAVAADWVRRELEYSSNPRLLIDVNISLTGRIVGETSLELVDTPFVNPDTRKLTRIRVIHRGLFKNWPGYYVDCYILSQSFNPKGFIQSFGLRSIDPF